MRLPEPQLKLLRQRGFGCELRPVITDGIQGENKRAVAAIARNEIMAVVYIQSSRIIRLDLRPLRFDSLVLSSYDPSSGTTNTLVIKPGLKQFLTLATPGSNRVSPDDWIFLVREK